MTIPVPVGALVFGALAPGLGFGLQPIPTGALVLTGLEPDLDPGIERPPTGALAFASTAPGLIFGALEVPVGTLTLAGQVPTSTDNTGITPPIGALVLQGLAPALPVERAPGAGALALDGVAPLRLTNDLRIPAAGALVLAGLVPTIASTGFFLPEAPLVLAGQVPTIVGPIDVPTGELVLVGLEPGIGPGTARLVLQGLAPSLVAPVIVVPTGALALQGFIDPLFTSASQTSTTSTFAVRRVRESPYVTEEQGWFFFSRLQLYLEMGVGLEGGATVQGHDPQIMLSWSENNGRTWSSERWVSAGKHGRFSRRAIWRRLGRSRKRLFRVAMSDPVRVRWVNAYLDVTKGTS